MDCYREGERYVLHFDLPASIRYLVSERATVTYSRQLVLGEGLDTDRVYAQYCDGVLTVTIPVAEQAKPRRIQINQTSDSGERPDARTDRTYPRQGRPVPVTSLDGRAPPLQPCRPGNKRRGPGNWSTKAYGSPQRCGSCIWSIGLPPLKRFWNCYEAGAGNPASQLRSSSSTTAVERTVSAQAVSMSLA